MNKKLAMKRLTEDIRRNDEFRETLQRFALKINTPDKADLAINHLYGLPRVADSKPVLTATIMLACLVNVEVTDLEKSEVKYTLVDLCRHLGSPDNCRIALCAIHHTLRGSFDLVLERDAGTVDYCFMWAIRRCINKIVDALAAAKLASAEDKED